MKERFNTSRVFKQRTQLIWNLKFHADTAAIFNQMIWLKISTVSA